MASPQDDEASSAPADPAGVFLDFWRRYFEQTAIQTRILFETMQGSKALGELHSQWIRPLSESLDSFMRTPAFLEILKQTLKQMVELKQQQNRADQSIAQQTGMPLTADSASVLERVLSANQAIHQRLTALEDRIQAVETILSSARAEQKAQREKEG
jgi:hypothetical protein